MRARLTDSLLAVIALCLVLIVLRLYGTGWEGQAQAAPALPGPAQSVVLVYQDSAGHWQSLASVDGVIRVAAK